MSLADATREALGWDLIAKAVAAQRDASRRRLLDEMKAAGSLKQGFEQWGTASLTGGDDTAEVFDPEAVATWTAMHRPEMMMQSVRPTWLKLLLEIAKTEGVALDPETGAVVPGIRRVQRPNGLLVRTSRQAQKAAEVMVTQFTAGALQQALSEVQEE